MRSALIFAAATAVCLFAAVFLFDACVPTARSPDVERETARAALLTTTDAVRALDEECARFVRTTQDRALGERCVAFYGPARAALIEAGHIVDAWTDEATRENITCTVVGVALAMALLAREIVGKGGRALPVITDSMALVSRLGGCPADGGST